MGTMAAKTMTTSSFHKAEAGMMTPTWQTGHRFPHFPLEPGTLLKRSPPSVSWILRADRRLHPQHTPAVAWCSALALVNGCVSRSDDPSREPKQEGRRPSAARPDLSPERRQPGWISLSRGDSCCHDPGTA